jgi:hypothetical protein
MHDGYLGRARVVRAPAIRIFADEKIRVGSREEVPGADARTEPRAEGITRLMRGT